MTNRQGPIVVPSPKGAGAPAGAMPPLPTTFPPGVNPETYQIDAVNRLLKSAAYLSIFSLHDPGKANIPIPSPRDPRSLIGIEVNEELHRFEVRVQEPTASGGWRATNRVGEPIANVHIRWMVIPDDFVAAPGREPPPTELNPQRSQRFTMLDGQMTFKDRKRSGIRAFGTGRTFPTVVRGQPQLRIGAVVNVLEGFGSLQGLPGTITVNGHIVPPQGLFLNFIARFLDAAGRLRARSDLRPLRTIPDPDPGTTFLMFLGEVDPDRPVTLNTAPDGRVLGSNLYELLRPVHIGFDVRTSKGIRGRTAEGPVVGRLSVTTFFDPFSTASPVPLQTRDGQFTFFDRRGCTVGTLRANLVEGRVHPTQVTGAPTPLLRIGGFGPLLGGTGLFDGATGMLSMNSVISLFPRTLSMLYVFGVIDPDGRFRAACHDNWS